MAEVDRKLQPDMRFAVATANVLNSATIKPAFTWNTEKHIDIATASGYNGIEIWPQRMRGRRFDALSLTSLPAEKKNGIISAHQTFVIPHSERTFPRKQQLEYFLPDAHDSLTDLEQIGAVVGDIPLVLFREAVPWVESAPFSQKGIQPQPELCKEIGATNAEEFVEAVTGMGFTNVVIDTHHLRRSHADTGEPNPLGDWRKSIPVLLPYTEEVHVGVGRTDTGDISPSQYYDELQDLLTGGNNNTEIVKMLRLIANLGWKGLVVVEAQPSVFPERNLLGQLSETSLKSSYEQIRTTLQSIFEE